MELAIRGALRCALCHAEAFGALDRCPGCGVVAHGDCRRPLDRCPTLGCEAPSPPVELDAPRVRGRDARTPARLLLGAALGAATLALAPALASAALRPERRPRAEPTSESRFRADAQAVSEACKRHRIRRGRWPAHLYDLLRQPGDLAELPAPEDGAYRLLRAEGQVFLAWEREGQPLRALPLYHRGGERPAPIDLEDG